MKSVYPELPRRTFALTSSRATTILSTVLNCSVIMSWNTGHCVCPGHITVVQPGCWLLVRKRTYQGGCSTVLG